MATTSFIASAGLLTIGVVATAGLFLWTFASDPDIGHKQGDLFQFLRERSHALYHRKIYLSWSLLGGSIRE
ncbi:hypothetical protein AGABI1DRAFT_87675 [Agaricus bisporus var. burnettii JB137-S8]|uniref:Uncharacterized protein n=1 Tax=Agaricus bisporus var. burnettii (strain JB137-S8 / ATCC MYA-4627 / FGSC 10392) TaxID=597362 RepID=K5XM56_AGABU|nr:uncharacterized protein AGABI1DRAFT_87675 [Agaricus bisporus var. burnettii JB137-S8]EKM75620.1 hypothetical protein AGABI1DRAFT_87675 [Agaricus bisporus var. burnettii JB137-S8]